MNLYLMRHGLAVERGTHGYESDRDRPLTAKGERRIRRVAEALLRMEISFDGMLSSPLIRARQTAELLNKEMKARHTLRFTEHLAPGGRVKELVRLIHRLPDSQQQILLVGHEPDLGQLASILLTGGDGLAVIFKKGAIANLDVGKLTAGRCATLEWLLTSRQLELMT